MPLAANADTIWSIGLSTRLSSEDGLTTSASSVAISAPSVELTPMTTFTIQHEREEDGRWIAEVPELPGVLAYGASADEAVARAEVLALRVLADRLEHKEAKPEPISIGIAAA
jgi:predicted RNase H-like HicB family nuclease